LLILVLTMQNALRYDYTGNSCLMEGADWFGRRPTGLQLHFHDEAQVSVVWNGHRDYRIGSSCVRLHPGQLLVIPGLRPHLALPSMDDEVQSVEFYLAPAALSIDAQRLLDSSPFIVIEHSLFKHAVPQGIAELALECVMKRLVSSNQPSVRPLYMPAKADLRETAIGSDGISDAARRFGYTREGFIRAFAREIGMTPNAYKINRRLNFGRQLLRKGESISEVAHETGFSDQSHFGRAFLRHFGATPGQFRAAHSGR
jgi:AraC-like DNA-binding protein